MLSFLLHIGWKKLWTLFFVSVISFAVIHLAPGEPGQIDPLNPRFTPEQLQRYREAFDLDKPLYEQYWLFYTKLFSGELRSFKDNQPVLPKIVERFWNSLPLFLVGTILIWCYAFPLGVASAIRRNSLFDKVTTVIVFALISIPGFYLAYLLIIFVVQTFHVDVVGLRTFGHEGVSAFLRLMDRTWHLVLPSVLGATAGIAVLSRYVRSQMLEVINSDYVRTARAKGLDEDTVLYKHALRNGLLVHGPTHWAAAIRTADGGLKVASGRKPDVESPHPRRAYASTLARRCFTLLTSAWICATSSWTLLNARTSRIFSTNSTLTDFP